MDVEDDSTPRGRGIPDATSLERLFLGAPELILQGTVDGTFVTVNPAFAQLLGRRPEDLVDTPILGVVHPEDLDATEVVFARFAEGRDLVGFVNRVRAADGSYRVCEWNGLAEAPGDGSACLFLAIGRDVTERRMVEEQLRNSEQRFADIVGAAGEYLYELDTDLRYTFLTPRAELLLARPVDETIGRRPWELVPPAAVEECARWWRGRLAAGESFRNEEQQILRPDGRMLWQLLHGVPIRDSLGRVRGFRGAGQDITDQREAQTALREAKEAAEAANHSKSAFLANMSHELRTPMTAILGFTELLQEPELDSGDRDSHLATIRRNGEHLLRLVNDILDLSKIEAGRLELEARPVRVATLVHETADLLRVRAEGKGLELEVVIDDGVPPWIETDAVRLRQVLVNLIGNGIKFTEQGGVRVTVRRLDDQLEFAVADTGIGLRPDQIERLFKPFSQVDESSTRRFGGTGLGLSISQRLAALLGGEIRIDSAFEKGSVFSLRIGCRAVAAPGLLAGGPQGGRAEAAPRGVPAPTDGASPRVLLVEDGPDNQRLISFLLRRRAGYEVDVAENGKVACDFMDEVLAGLRAPYGAILMDMQMPVRDGYQSTRYLRARGVVTPIIALTAHAMAGDREKCLEAGCDEFQTKPIDREALLGCLAKVVAQRA